MFPRLEEGGLATYRAALVQNQHLTVLAEVWYLPMAVLCIVYVTLMCQLMCCGAQHSWRRPGARQR